MLDFLLSIADESNHGKITYLYNNYHDDMIRFAKSRLKNHGYKLVQKIVNPVNIFYQFENDNGEYLKFRQVVLDITNCGFDGEEGNSLLYEFSGFKIYCRELDTSLHYIWNDGEYSLRLTSSVELDETELEKIVLGASKT